MTRVIVLLCLAFYSSAESIANSEPLVNVSYHTSKAQTYSMPNDLLLTQENSAEARAPDLASLVLDLEGSKVMLGSLGVGASHRGAVFNTDDIIAKDVLIRMQGRDNISTFVLRVKLRVDHLKNLLNNPLLDLVILQVSKMATHSLFNQLWPHEKVDLVDLIGSVKYRTWESAVVYICENKKDLARSSIVEVLTTEYGDQTLCDALKVKQAMNEHDEVARSLSDAQVHMWATTGKDPENVFMWLKGSGNGDFFKPILRRGWETFVKYRNRGENPYELVIEVLKKLHHRDGEDEVDQMLADILTNAVKDKVDVVTYRPFQNALLKTWRKADMTHDRVEHLLWLEDPISERVKREIVGMLLDYENTPKEA
ncbi:unnamed protein product [Peronospora belbahrii]|uniref:RxLR effector candidate protein n=1 Tax=Peronospora belbahrii TaxID=622444 RepID=A0ABN8D9V2_9STRA|nr:unnamed protein product [Peronospora belbahrii]